MMYIKKCYFNDFTVFEMTNTVYLCSESGFCKFNCIKCILYRRFGWSGNRLVQPKHR